MFGVCLDFFFSLVHVPFDNMDEAGFKTYNAAHQGVIKKCFWLHTHTHFQLEARHDQTVMILVYWRYTAGRNTGRTQRPCGQRPNPLITSSQFIPRCPSPQENGRCIRCVTCQKIYWFHTRRAVPVFCSLLVFCGSCSFLSLFFTSLNDGFSAKNRSRRWPSGTHTIFYFICWKTEPSKPLQRTF